MEYAIGNINTIQQLRYVDAFFLLLNSVEANQHKNEMRWLILNERSKKNANSGALSEWTNFICVPN